VEYVSEKGVSDQLRIPLLHPHAEVGSLSVQSMSAKLELLQHKPEINLQERCSNFFRKAQINEYWQNVALSNKKTGVS
jgi:hypothetical protein